MPIYNLDDVVAYMEREDQLLLCSDCFQKLPKEEQKIKLWYVIEREEIKEPGDQLWVCDECNEEIE
jgi:hypothetical protein